MRKDLNKVNKEKEIERERELYSSFPLNKLFITLYNFFKYTFLRKKNMF